MNGSNDYAIKRVGVLGAGNGGITFAAHFLDTPGVEWVSLYNRSPARREPICARGNRIFSRGEIGGPGGKEMKLALVTGDPVEASRDADLIIMAGIQQAIDPIGRALGSHVRPDQVIMIGSGTLGSTWEMRASLRAGGCKDLPVVGEFNILPYATKLDDGVEGRVWVRGVKKALDTAFVPEEAVDPAFRAKLLEIYDCLNIFPDVLYTGLSGANMVFHPVVVMRNLHKIEAGRPWRLYEEGVTPEVSVLFDLVDKERMAIARACGIEMVTMLKFLSTAYPPFDGAEVTNIYEWFRSRMRSKEGQVHLEAVPGPLSVNVRLIEEDVPYGMVPLEALGNIVGVATPTISAFIDEAVELMGVDYRKTGRSLEKMGDEMRASLKRIGGKDD